MTKSHYPSIFTAFCNGETWFSISLNLVSVVSAVLFAVTVHLFTEHQKEVERVAGIRNPYDGFMTTMFWSSIAGAVVFATFVVVQVVRRLKERPTDAT